MDCHAVNDNRYPVIFDLAVSFVHRIKWKNDARLSLTNDRVSGRSRHQLGGFERSRVS